MNRREWLILSDERASWMRRCQDWFRWGWRVGYRAGIDEGRWLEGAERDELWRYNAGMIVIQLDPDGPYAKQARDQHLRRIDNLARRDGEMWFREFEAKAYATPVKNRTEQQDAMFGE